jgi:SAM-dependent methyltransferase
LDVASQAAEPLRKVHLERDLVPRSEYEADWHLKNAEKYLPALAHWAWLCLSFYDVTKDEPWLEAAQLAVYYLKAKQLQDNNTLRGALPASVPLWGAHQPMTFPNSSVKFFADALLAYEGFGLAVWQEQEEWVKHCFAVELDDGAWHAASSKLGSFDIEMCRLMLDGLKTLPPGATILDLGCGEGRYLRHMQASAPQWKFLGVDPGAAAGDATIQRGSASRIPLGDGVLDAAYMVMVLQHVDDLPLALREIRRVLKPGGFIVIGDRDLHSGRGVSKPWHELTGRWMYPWDSPFRERWYSARQWRRALTEAGFEMRHWQRVLVADDGWRRLVRMNGFLLLFATRK